jgi:hypothetical protein
MSPIGSESHQRDKIRRGVARRNYINGLTFALNRINARRARLHEHGRSALEELQRLEKDLRDAIRRAEIRS